MAQSTPSPASPRIAQIRAGEVVPVGEKTWVKRGHAARGNPAGLPRAAARLYALIGERVATSALGRVSGMGSDELARTLALLIERSLVVVETEIGGEDDSFDLDFTAPETLDRLRDAAEQSRQAEEAARQQVEAERKAKEEAEARVRAEADAKARAEASARANAAALARLKAEKVERSDADREINTRQGALERARSQAQEHADTLARAELEARSRAEALRKAEAEAAARMAAVRKLEQEMRARMAALAKLEAERKQKAEASARADAERLAAERRAREEADARAASERLAREQAEAAARAEAQAQLDAERRAREDAEARAEAERRAREEAEALARTQAEAAARAEAERLETERLAREQAAAEAQAALEAERRAREEAEARAEATAKAEAEAAARAEAERRTREESDREVKRSPENDAEPGPAPASRQATGDAPAPAAPPGRALPGAEAALQPLGDLLADFDFDRKASSTLWDTADARSFAADQSLGSAPPKSTSELGISVTSLADEVQRALEEAEARDRREQERRKPPARQKRRPRDTVDHEGSTASGARADESSLPSISPTIPDEDPAVIEARRLEREAEEQRLLAEEQARQRAREATEVAARARAEREKSERRLEREHEQVQAQAQALARERLDVESLKVPRRPRPAWLRPAIAALAIAAVLGLPEVIPYGSPVPDLERRLSERTGLPVSIGRLHLSLVPLPAFRLREVRIGAGEDAITFDALRAQPRLSSLLSGPLVIDRMHIDTGRVPASSLERLPSLLAAPGAVGYPMTQVTFDRVRISLPAGLDWPVSAGQVDWSASGTLERLTLRATDGSASAELSAAGGGFGLKVVASQWQARAEPPLVFQSLQASGRIGASSLEDGRFVAEVIGGRATGEVRATWSPGSGIAATGTAQLAGVDASPLVALLSSTASAAGALDANLQFELSGRRLVDLPATARAAASFIARQGWVGGLDLVLLIRDAGARGGRTVFDEWSGTFAATTDGQALRQMKLVSGPLSASGSLEVARDGRVGGRVSAELQSAGSMLRSNVVLGGSLREITAAPAN